MLRDVCTCRKHGTIQRLESRKKIVCSPFSNAANGRHDDPVLLPKNEGMINIHLKCVAQASLKTIVIYAEYEGMMEINSIKGATSI